MRTGLSQQTSMRQELRVNPRLYQAMDMLYMPMMDLQQHLKQELLANPFLELLEPEEDENPEQADTKQEKEQQQKDDEVDWEEILLNGFDVGGTREQYEQLEYTEPVTVETTTLADHLQDQLQMLDLTPRQQLLAEEFVGNINDDGYLAATLEEILDSVNSLMAAHHAARNGGNTDDEDEDELTEVLEEIPTGHPAEMLGEPEAPARPAWADLPPELLYTMADLEQMLGIIQRLDPPGIGARDLRECLLLQLREAKDTPALTHRLVDEAFPDLIAHRWNDLAKRFSVDPAAVQKAADELARFDPKPGLKHADKGDVVHPARPGGGQDRRSVQGVPQ